jgi:putative inorganic carbon (HCO3(-)) transporter
VPVTPLNGTLLLLLAAVLLSLTASFDVSYSAPKVLGLVLEVALFFALVRAIRTLRAVTVAIELFAVAGGALAAIGLLGTHWLDKVPVLNRMAAHAPAVIRLPGLSEGFQPNAVGGTLILFIPLQFALVVAERASRAGRRAVFLTTLVVTTAVLVLTQSRNAWLSLLVAVAASAIWASRGRVRRAGIALVLVTAIAGAAVWVQARPLVERVVGAGLPIDVLTRVELWSRAIDIIEDFPFTGVGMSGFRRVVPVMYPALLADPASDVVHAHNHLLQAGVDLGLPGLIAYLALWLGVAAMLVRTARGSTDARVRLMAGGLGAGLLAFFSFGTADTIALGAKGGAVFWVAIALATALNQSWPQART